MKNLGRIALFLICFIGFNGFGQSKSELREQIEKKQKSLDSLEKVNANFENIIESRDRTIGFKNDDIAKYESKLRDLAKELKNKQDQILKLQTKLNWETATGEAKIMTLSNSRSTLKVPEGKYWVINQFITDYLTEMQSDSTGNLKGEEIHVFIKAIDGDVMTDTTKNQYGPQLYSSVNNAHSMRFPIVLTENTSFTILLMKGALGKMTPYSGNVYCSFTERKKR